MNDDKLRRRIAAAAARLLVNRQESQLGRARIRAARQVCRGYVKPAQFPSETEIRDVIERLSYVREGDARFDNLREMRRETLRLLRMLAEFDPVVIGDMVAGVQRSGGLIEIVIDASHQEAAVEQLLQHAGPDGKAAARFPVDIDFRNRLPGEGRSLADFETLVADEYPDIDPDQEFPDDGAGPLDRFQVYRMLLAPLAQVEQPRRAHPEGDALFHSLQVYELAREENPYDEEFQLAALLHDVGKGIDPRDPDRASRDALDGYVTQRTSWLIENLRDARRILDNSIGARARRRLQQHPDFEQLMQLARCDRAGRVPGAPVPELDAALDEVRDLARLCGP